MIRVLLCLLVLLGACSFASAQDIFVEGGDPVCLGSVCQAVPSRVVRSDSPRRVVVRQENNIFVRSSAQADAEAMAATGVLRHQGNNCGRREGIGFSSASADDAIRRCCYYGRYFAREIGVARGRRGWFACIRYE